jgi:hypothetical protein
MGVGGELARSAFWNASQMNTAFSVRLAARTVRISVAPRLPCDGVRSTSLVGVATTGSAPAG